MRDIVVRVFDPWVVNSEEGHKVILADWNFDVGARGETLPIVDVEEKLRKLAVVNFNNHNWS